MSVRLFVGNLPYDATEDEIRSHFSTVGNLSYVSIPLDRETGKKRGFAFVEFADAQQAPEWFTTTPSKAIPRAVAKAGLKMQDIEYFEINEAFSVQSVAVIKELGIDPEKVNVNGGAVALGHPIGASGARVLVTLIYELIRRNGKKGIAALCLGGGNSVAMAVERR